MVKIRRIVPQRLPSSICRSLNFAFNGRSSFRNTRAKRRSDKIDEEIFTPEEEEEEYDDDDEDFPFCIWKIRAGTDFEL